MFRLRTFILMANRLQQVGMGRRHPPERIARADLRDSALVAVYAAVVADLEEEGAVAEPVAAFDALGAADAEFFVYGVFVIRILDKAAPDSAGGAELVFGARVQVVRLGSA